MSIPFTLFTVNGAQNGSSQIVDGTGLKLTATTSSNSEFVKAQWGIPHGSNVIFFAQVHDVSSAPIIGFTYATNAVTSWFGQVSSHVGFNIGNVSTYNGSGGQVKTFSITPANDDYVAVLYKTATRKFWGGVVKDGVLHIGNDADVSDDLTAHETLQLPTGGSGAVGSDLVMPAGGLFNASANGCTFIFDEADAPVALPDGFVMPYNSASSGGGGSGSGSGGHATIRRPGIV